VFLDGDEVISRRGIVIRWSVLDEEWAVDKSFLDGELDDQKKI
jgi:hypothetical protein